ncbi:MAG: hypothetical protein AAGA75_08885 [Cyanobacteria bacterium P01_E01_bin.6]
MTPHNLHGESTRYPLTEPRSFQPRDCPAIRLAIQAEGIPLRSGALPYFITLEIVGENSPLGRSLIQEYTGREADFGSFIPGTSDEQVIKAMYDAASFGWLPEFQQFLKKRTGQFFPAAPTLDCAVAYREQQKRFDAIRRALLQGRARDVGVSRDLWREDIWPVGRPETAKAHEIIDRPIASASPIYEQELLWPYGHELVPIGRAFFYQDRMSLLLDGRPYNYLGHECRVGKKKNLLLVKMSSRVKAQIRSQVASKLYDKLAS